MRLRFGREPEDEDLLCIGEGYANLVEAHCIEYFECAAHAHEVSRVIEVEESAAELGSLRIHCQSSRREFGEADVAGLKRDTYVKHPALPVRLPFLTGSSYTFVYRGGEVGADVLDALMRLGRAV